MNHLIQPVAELVRTMEDHIEDRPAVHHRHWMTAIDSSQTDNEMKKKLEELVNAKDWHRKRIYRPNPIFRFDRQCDDDRLIRRYYQNV